MRYVSYLIAISMTGVAIVSTDSAVCADESVPAPDVIRAAINKSIPLLEKGTKGSADQRQCFTCHSQAVPVLALAEVRKRGFTIDEENFERQLQHTSAHLESGKQSYLDGRGQGGKVVTAGYALWALEAGGRTPDETTAAVTGFLIEYQKDEAHWRQPSNRPPSSGSDFTTTYLALRGLVTFGTDGQQPKIEARSKTIGEWLLSESPRDTEDRVFRLLALPFVEAGEDAISEATSELFDCQQDDGGWAQTSDRTSDPYATATVIVALVRAGGISADHTAVRRGVNYLLSTQLDDGSWHVATRAKAFQTYFESGFPHGKDQFISIAASSWCTLALVMTLEDVRRPRDRPTTAGCHLHRMCNFSRHLPR